MDMNVEFRGLTAEQKRYKDRVNVHAGITELITREERAILDEACVNFEGNVLELERAIGALVLGKYVGWKVLRLVHDSSTYAKYERILGAGEKGFKFKEHCPDRGPLSRRSVGLVWADKIDNFWRVVRGQVPGARSPEVELDPQLPEGVG